jgi:hypothetical protein
MNDLKIRLINLNPQDIVKSDLDGFYPYAYVEVPPDIQKEVDQLTSTESNEWDDFLTDLLFRLQDSGIVEWKV